MKRFSNVWLPLIVLMGIHVVFFNACKDKDEVPSGLSTESVYKITDNSAICGGNVTLEGSSGVTARGVCWCCNSSPTTSDSTTTDSQGTGEFVSTLTGLMPNTTYHVRAYATNDAGTGYGNEVIFDTPPLVIDLDGNTYHTVKIGDQTWMAENLNVTHYRNGDEIPNVSGNAEWAALTTGGYCHYNDHYGNLYNFYAVKDDRGLAPSGWHIPSDAEWKELEGSVDSQYPAGDAEWDKTDLRGFDAGGMLKSITNDWFPPNEGATDMYGFSAIPCGYRHWTTGQYLDVSGGAYFATSTAVSETTSWSRGVSNIYTQVWRTVNSNTAGGSVRCVQDISE